jgi:hypothetical protein
MMDLAGKFIASVTLVAGDPTFSILKAHLVFEEMLRAFLERTLPRPEELKGSRLTFSQLLAVSRASRRSLKTEEWVWTAISELNKLRNLLAHNLEPEKLREKTDEYIRFVANGLNKPLPEPEGRGVVHGSAAIEAGQQLYSSFDMVTIGLYGWAMALLGLDPDALKLPTSNLSK